MNLKYFYLFLCVFTHSLVGAQVLEGHVQYKIRTTAVDTSKETIQKVLMFQKSKMDIFFMPKKSRIDFDLGGMLYSCIVVDHTIPRGISMNKSAKGAYCVYLGKNELDFSNKKKDSTSRIELMNETQEILGFQCKKAILYQNNEVAIYWYCPDITVEKSSHPLLNDLLPGFPLSFSTVKEGMRIEYTAVSFIKQLEQKDQVFSLMVPEGYELVNNQVQKK